MRMHLDLLDLHERFVEKVAQQLLIEIFNLAVLKRLKISFEFSQFVFPNYSWKFFCGRFIKLSSNELD
jgi:hypothetical protein